MRRIVVLGAGGYFGSAAAELLKKRGVPFVAAGRGSGFELRVDAERPDALREGDVVLDAAGPFQRRTAALFEAAIAKRFDVVDLSDSMSYAKTAVAMAPRFEGAGIRILTSCSSASALSAALVRATGVPQPRTARVFLAAASRRSARYGTSASALSSVGREIEVLRGGRAMSARGWSDPRAFDFGPPVGLTMCRLVEFPDALLLPREFPSLEFVESRAATRIRGLDVFLSVASRIPGAIPAIRASLSPLTVALLRPLGREGGVLGVDVDSRTVSLVSGGAAHVMAAMPAALAARRLARDEVRPRGLLAGREAVPDEEIFRELATEGVRLSSSARSVTSILKRGRGMEN